MSPVKAIFFDAADTLIHLPQSVGFHYALVGKRIGLTLEAAALDLAFATSWQQMPPRSAIDGPRPDDDREWWRTLIDHVFEQVAPGTSELDRDSFFEVAYSHFAEAGVWQLYPDVEPALETLSAQYPLAVVSNFDGRLRFIFEHLGVSKYFRNVFLSSELGADKPDPLIYQRALNFSGFAPGEVLHVGDDPERDWKGAATAGLQTFRLERPSNSLVDLIAVL